jgi:hypothetical protein
LLLSTLIILLEPGLAFLEHFMGGVALSALLVVLERCRCELFSRTLLLVQEPLRTMSTLLIELDVQEFVLLDAGTDDPEVSRRLLRATVMAMVARIRSWRRPPMPGVLVWLGRRRLVE